MALVLSNRSRTPRTVWSVGSAGTQALVGEPIHVSAREALTERDVPVPPGGGVQITPDVLASAGVVLTATRDHRRTVARVAPGAVKRTFTIRQFARLCEAGRSAGGRSLARSAGELVEFAQHARSSVQPVSGDHDDIADPIGRPVEEFRQCRDLIAASIAQIAAAIDPAT